MNLRADLARTCVAVLAVTALRTGANVARAAEPSAAAAPADAAPAPDSADGGEVGSINEVIVTGTRVSGIKVADSPAPIMVISGDELRQAGAPDLMSSLSNVIPGFVKQAFGGDMANQTLQIKLRGLSPNHTLVLVD